MTDTTQPVPTDNVAERPRGLLARVLDSGIYHSFKRS